MDRYCTLSKTISETSASLNYPALSLSKSWSSSLLNFYWMIQTPDVAAAPDPAPSASVVVEEPSITTHKETAPPKPMSKQPLSPYTA